MASLVSYGMTVDLLKDVLPIDRANISTVRRDLNKIAVRAEAELDGERPCPSQGAPDVRQAEADPVVVGIDGGYVRNLAIGYVAICATSPGLVPFDHAPDRGLSVHERAEASRSQASRRVGQRPHLDRHHLSLHEALRSKDR